MCNIFYLTSLYMVSENWNGEDDSPSKIRELISNPSIPSSWASRFFLFRLFNTRCLGLLLSLKGIPLLFLINESVLNKVFVMILLKSADLSRFLMPLQLLLLLLRLLGIVEIWKLKTSTLQGTLRHFKALGFTKVKFKSF